MRIFPHLLASVCLISAGIAYAQNASPAPAAQYAPGSQAAPDFGQPPAYFSLEHRAPERMHADDSELLRAKQSEVATASQFYGYDLSIPGWSYEQVVCPQLPDYLMLHYMNLLPNGAESIFTALVPRNDGRVRIVPAFYRNATPFHPAVKNSRNYAMFNELVPADIAKDAVQPGGAWLSLAVCYAEMVGGRPLVLQQPGRDIATILLPQPTLYISAPADTRQIRFNDRYGDQQQYTTWTLSLNGHGRLVEADNEWHTLQASHISVPPIPASTVIQPPPAPASKLVQFTPGPAGKAIPQPDVPHQY